MINDILQKKFKAQIKGEVKTDEPLANHSTIKIGGMAALFVTPADAEDLVALLNLARAEKLEVFVLGAGSNVLFRDGGFGGVVINMSRFDRYETADAGPAEILLKAQSGVRLAELIAWSVKNGWTGLENLAGIPGTVGGAVIMNAGTYEGTIADTLTQVVGVDRSGRHVSWPKDRLEFSYRHTKFPRSCIIVESWHLLVGGQIDLLESKVAELRAKRAEKHPREPSLGSIFKNPRKGASAGSLIEEAGLKGVRIGKARLSDKHANWIINEGGARSKDVEVLINLIKEKVKEETNVSLETEIKVVGRDRKPKSEIQSSKQIQNSKSKISP